MTLRIYVTCLNLICLNIVVIPKSVVLLYYLEDDITKNVNVCFYAYNPINFKYYHPYPSP